MIYTYTVLIDLGIVIGLCWLYLSAARVEGFPRPARRMDAGLVTAIGGLAGARLGHVVANWAYFGNHLGEAIRIWEGGLAWPGAVAVGALALWGYCRWRREAFWPIADVLAFPIVVVAALAWLGCAANACAPGREVAPGALPAWFAVDWPDSFGIRALRWPTQILGAAWSSLCILATWLTRKRMWPAAMRPLLAIGGIALGGFGLAFTRGDAMPQMGGLRLDAAASGIVLLVALILLPMTVHRGNRLRGAPS